MLVSPEEQGWGSDDNVGMKNMADYLYSVEWH